MPSTRPFSELVAKIPAEAMARAAERNKNLSDEIDLATLRRARRLTQQQLAAKMHVNQPEVAKIEKRADMLLSTLASVLHAMGAELKIIARFPGHDIRIGSLVGPKKTRPSAARGSLGSAPLRSPGAPRRRSG